ncbi:LysM domain-containing protein [Paenibacillus sp. yr247]|uniref:LysM peptidoglycan-binding domain-containing protein n=1 Tax=Paenibacillus sp. yr247 TaxID=1761880 RepID=UPI00087FA59E|nr:LysM peptidoglycan-binding domain-containing protein [Paenibacillus sp. yr247]SDN83358.1 LysM domain-containing protein [Paenibacillus sp. yr247]
MYIAYSHTNNSRKPHRSASASKGMTPTFGYTKAIVRFVLLAVILGTVFSFGAMVQAYAGDGAAATPVTITSANHISKVVVQDQVIIQRGDTLWNIASSHKKSDENIRSYVDKIKSINHLNTSSLKEGQVLSLP